MIWFAAPTKSSSFFDGGNGNVEVYLLMLEGDTWNGRAVWRIRNKNKQTEKRSSMREHSVANESAMVLVLQEGTSGYREKWLVHCFFFGNHNANCFI